MMNELVFILHTAIISCFALGALALGRYALVAFVCVQCILANLFVIKQTTLFGLHATCSDAFTVGATLGLNLLQEYFGRDITKKAIWINFFMLIFYAIVSQIHLAYTPSIVDSMHPHFQHLLTFMPRIVIASFSVYLFVHFVDYYLYGTLKRICNQKYLLIRNYASIIICQLIDTILFSFLGLYGIIEHIWQVILVSYLIKLAAIFVITPFISFSRRIYQATRQHHTL